MAIADDPFVPLVQRHELLVPIGVADPAHWSATPTGMQARFKIDTFTEDWREALRLDAQGFDPAASSGPTASAPNGKRPCGHGSRDRPARHPRGAPAARG